MITLNIKTLILPGLLSVTMASAQPDLRNSILSDPASFYYIDFARYPQQDAQLPIGVFDSGTGGLTVFNAIATFDEHNNLTNTNGPDGQPDFSREDFIYLADQANMPYGNYSAAGKTDFLKELILKDVQFLMGPHYYNTQFDLQKDKKPVKAIVIACNTATAYGKSDAEALLAQAGSPLKVIGVIDAGVRGALSHFKPTDSGTIGIFATVGTVASNGYQSALGRYRQTLGYTGDIQVVSQGGLGLAEAIDEEPNFISKAAQGVRANYRGPSLSPDAAQRIDKALLEIYNFDFSNSKMLCDAKNVDDCSQLQLNSAENYVRYHLVSMLENLRSTPNAQPLKALILGCTHYPYMENTIRQVLGELRGYKSGRKYRYRYLIARQIEIIDPAQNTARELYEYLYQQKMFNAKGDMANNTQFFISVPNPQVTPPEGLEDNGTRFTYNYKYGRSAGENKQHVWVTPFSSANISSGVAERLKQQIPVVYRMIEPSLNPRKI
jgi:glutamate racemase